MTKSHEGDGSADGHGRAGCQGGRRQQQHARQAHADAQGARFVVAQHQQIDVASPQQDHSRGHDDQRSRDVDVVPGSRIEAARQPEQDLAQRFVVGQAE